MKLRVHLAVADPIVRARLSALLRADAEVVLVGQPEEADLIVTNGAVELAEQVLEEGTALTPREVEVLRLMAMGLGNKTIARQLGISVHTAKYHAASVFAKLGVHTRTEAVSLGIRQGLVPL